MNETTIMSDWSKDEQKFADVIIKIIEYKQAKYEEEYQEGRESKRVPLADIKICPANFENYIPEMQGINRHRDWKVTAEWMLRLLCEKDELVVYPRRSTYTLSKVGKLYKHLTKN